MSWAKLDDAILDNPKIVAAGPLCFALYVAGITWSCRNLTDGFIPGDKVAVLINWNGVCDHVPLASDSDGDFVTATHVSWARLTTELVSEGLWIEVPRGYMIHDFLVYNRSKEQVLREREAARERKAGRGSRRVRKSSRGVRTNSVVSSAPPVPVPVPVPVPRKGITRSLRSLVVTDPPEFAIWWAVYPRKLKKAEARKVWRTLFATQPPPIDRMLDAIGWQRQTADWLEHSGKYIPHPDTYLRGRRWEDEPTPTPGAFADPRTSGNAQVLAEVLADIQEGRHA